MPQSTSQTALITLLEVVLGPLWVWLAYRENPGTATLIGGVVVLLAVVFQTTERSRAPVVAPIDVDATSGSASRRTQLRASLARVTTDQQDA